MTHTTTTHRLVATWCFAEAGLGGLMHALHIPLTGFLIGGLSVLINTFLALQPENRTARLVTALGTVLLVKFALSPQSPIGAYVAVCFQGLLAIVLYQTFGVNRSTILLYSILVMAENAVQKPVMAAVIFGRGLWDGLLRISRDFLGFGNDAEVGVFVFLGLYLLVYLFWGVVLAIWCWRFIRQVRQVPADAFPVQLPSNEPPNRSRSRYLRHAGMVLFLVVVALILFWESDPGLEYLLRVVALLLFFGLVLPISLRFFMGIWLRRNRSRVQMIQDEFPRIRNNFRSAWHHSGSHRGIGRLRQFLFLSIFFNVFHETPHPPPNGPDTNR